MLLDQKPDPRLRGNEIPTIGGTPVDPAPDEVQAAPAYIIEREVGQTVRGPPANRAPDEVQVAPAYSIEHEAGQTVGIAPVIRSADSVQSIPSPIVERNSTPVSTSLDRLSVVMVMVALGLTTFAFAGRYAKRALAFSAMRRLQPPPDYMRPVDLLMPPQKQVEADPDTASIVEAVKKALDTIAEAEAEMSSSRQLRTRS